MRYKRDSHSTFHPVRVDAGSMTLKLDEDKYVYVEENTEFKLIAQGTDENSKTAIELTKGAITNEIQNKLSTESSYEVNTPNATMAVRGTVFRVEVTYDEAGVCYTKVSTLEGKVACRLVYADGSVSEQEVLIEHGYEVIIYQDDKNTDYMGDVEPIDFSKLPQAVSERFGALIDELKEELGLKEETTNQKSEYTVTFLYNGAVFGTQTVKAGACAQEPSLMPEAGGSWDYDFSKPVMEDITIEWK